MYIFAIRMIFDRGTAHRTIFILRTSENDEHSIHPMTPAQYVLHLLHKRPGLMLIKYYLASVFGSHGSIFGFVLCADNDQHLFLT